MVEGMIFLSYGQDILELGCVGCQQCHIKQALSDGLFGSITVGIENFTSLEFEKRKLQSN